MSPRSAFVAKELFLSAAGIAIAVGAGASIDEAATALVWGALLFGGAMGLLLLVFGLASLRSKSQWTVEPGSEPRKGRLDGFFETIFGSWRGVLFMLVVLGFAAIDDPSLAALIAGYGLGTAAIATPVTALLRILHRRFGREGEVPRLD